MLIDKIIKSYSSTEKWPEWTNSLKISSFYRHLLVHISVPLLKYTHLFDNKLISGRTDSRVIVSLTSFPARINIVVYSIISLLRQTIKPRKIVLWLSKEQFSNKTDLPTKLLELEKYNLEIRFVEGDLKSHKKYYYAFKEFANDYVMLADDDIFYPADTIEQLIENMDSYSVNCSYGRILTYGSDGHLIPYNNWRYTSDIYSESDYFFGTGGGTLLKPSSLYKDTCNKDLFMSLCPKADDIWLNAMVRLANLNIKRVRTGLIFPLQTKSGVSLASVNLAQNYNDIQINRVNEYYLRTNKKQVF